MASEGEIDEVVMLQDSALDAVSPSKASVVEIIGKETEPRQRAAAQYGEREEVDHGDEEDDDEDDDEEEEEEDAYEEDASSDEDEEDDEDDEAFSDDDDFDEAPTKKKRKTGKETSKAADASGESEAGENLTGKSSRPRAAKASPAKAPPATPPRRARRGSVSTPQSSGKRSRRGAKVDKEEEILKAPAQAGLPASTQVVETSQLSEKSDASAVEQKEDDEHDMKDDREKASRGRGRAVSPKASESASESESDAEDVEMKEVGQDEATAAEDDEEEKGEEGEDEEEEEAEEPENPLEAEIGTLDSASRTVYDYLKRTNRPFSVLDISRALSSLTKLQVTKSLTKLVDLGIAHANDKKVHWLEQSVFGNTDASALAKTTAKLDKRTGALDRPNRELAALKRDIADLASEPADADLDAELERLRAQIGAQKGEMVERNGAASGENDATAANLRARAEVGQEVLEKEFKFYKGIWRSRRDVVQNCCQDILENTTKKVKLEKFYEDIGIESDAVFKVNIRDVRLHD